MSIPNCEQMLRPILALATEQPITRKGVAPVIADRFQLTKEERESRIPSGHATYVRNRVGWAMTFLTKGYLIEKTAPRTYQITAQGQSFLAEHPTAITEADLRTLPGYQKAWQSSKKQPGQSDLDTPPEVVWRATRPRRPRCGFPEKLLPGNGWWGLVDVGRLEERAMKNLASVAGVGVQGY